MFKTTLLSLFTLALSSSSFAAPGLFPTTVKEVDLSKMQGRWYEVASSDPLVTRICACTTVDYSFNSNHGVGALDIAKSCRLGAFNGQLTEWNAIAYPGSSPAKFKLSVGGITSPFENYWIIALADDYRYAVVSTGFRNPVLVLSRMPDLTQADASIIGTHLYNDGYDLNKMVNTLHDGCKYPGE